MPILADLHFSPGPKFAVPRSYLRGFVVDWWTMDIEQAGRQSIFREHPFGGNHLHVSFRSNVWAWSSNDYTLDYFLEDLYMVPPGGGSPVSPGRATLIYEFDNRYHLPELVLLMQPADSHFAFQDLPRSIATYWNEPLNYPRATPFLEYVP